MNEFSSLIIGAVYGVIVFLAVVYRMHARNHLER